MNIMELRTQMEAIRRNYPELEEDEDALRDTLEGATDMRGVLAKLVRELGESNTLLYGLQARLVELGEREDRYEARSRYIRELIFKVLESAGTKKIELAEATLSLRDGKPRLEGDPDPKTVADEFCRITRTIDKTKVRAAMEAGEHVPGFHLSNAQPSLVVKVR